MPFFGTDKRTFPTQWQRTYHADKKKRKQKDTPCKYRKVDNFYIPIYTENSK